MIAPSSVTPAAASTAIGTSPTPMSIVPPSCSMMIGAATGPSVTSTAIAPDEQHRDNNAQSRAAHDARSPSRRTPPGMPSSAPPAPGRASPPGGRSRTVRRPPRLPRRRPLLRRRRSRRPAGRHPARCRRPRESGRAEPEPELDGIRHRTRSRRSRASPRIESTSSRPSSKMLMPV